MIHHNHIEFFPKEVCDEWPLGGNIVATQLHEQTS